MTRYCAPSKNLMRIPGLSMIVWHILMAPAANAVPGKKVRLHQNIINIIAVDVLTDTSLCQFHDDCDTG